MILTRTALYQSRTEMGAAHQFIRHYAPTLSLIGSIACTFVLTLSRTRVPVACAAACSQARNGISPKPGVAVKKPTTYDPHFHGGPKLFQAKSPKG